MERTLSFLRDKKEKYYKCPRCRSETKHQKATDEDLNFKEELYRVSGKRY
jgi:hypothetical protein